MAAAECSDDRRRCLSRRTPAVTAGMKNKRQAQTRWLIFSTTDPLNVSPAAASDEAPAAPRLFQRLESSLELWSGGTSRSYHLAPFKTPELYLHRQRRVSACKTLAVLIGLSQKWRPCSVQTHRRSFHQVLTLILITQLPDRWDTFDLSGHRLYCQQSRIRKLIQTRKDGGRRT